MTTKDQWIRFAKQMRDAYYSVHAHTGIDELHRIEREDKDSALYLLREQEDLVKRSNYADEVIKAATATMRDAYKLASTAIGVTGYGRETLTLGSDDERGVHTATWSCTTYPIIFPIDWSKGKEATLVNPDTGETIKIVMYTPEDAFPSATDNTKEQDESGLHNAR